MVGRISKATVTLWVAHSKVGKLLERTAKAKAEILWRSTAMKKTSLFWTWFINTPRRRNRFGSDWSGTHTWASLNGLTMRFQNTPTGTLVNRTDKHQNHAATCGLEMPFGLVVIGMTSAAWIVRTPVVLSARGCPRLHPPSKPKVERLSNLAFYKTKEH